jgi:non-specific serine/threonine protein kinase
VRDPRLIPATIARALDVRESGGRSAWQLLLTYLQERQVLLLLDNFEQVLGGARLLAELLATCPRLALLVTSRAALRLRSERRFSVPPLASPADELLSMEALVATPAVRLFVERARAVSPDFILDAGNAQAVAAICRRLDGMPLAIELAAARVGLLRPEALLRRLEHRLPLLTGGAPDLPERQQTLRQTLAWSHDLLGPAEQVLLRRLAVFAGGWALEAAEAVCTNGELLADDVLERLEALVDTSLVQRAGGSDGELRFGMLETVREYAVGQLEASGEAEAARAHHRDWCVALAERALPELTGPDQLAWYSRLAGEMENFRAARECSQRDTGGAAAGLRLAAALGRYFEVRAPGLEGRRWLSEALAEGPPEPSAALARALTWSGQLESRYGEAEAGRARLEQAVAVARQACDRPLLCLTLRHLALYTPERAVAPALLEEAAALARAAGDRRELALALCYLGIARRQAGDEAAASALCAQAVAAARASGDQSALTPALFTLGGLEIARGQYNAAQALLDEALEVSEMLDHRGYMNTVNRLLAQLALARGDLGAARARVRASLELARPSRTGAVGLRVLQLAAQLAVGSGDHRRAVRLFAAVDSWQGRHDVPPGSTVWTGWTWTPRDDENAVSAARAALAALGEPAFAAAWAEGLRLSLDDAIDDALAAVGLGGFVGRS